MELKKGDKIGIIALSGDCNKEQIEQAKINIESLGYKVKLSKNIFDKNRYLAGRDKEKIDELHRFFLDKEIKLILCARGGYGAIRLIKDIDYKLIKNNTKPFCGFSDATTLLLMIYKNARIITYHSPMAQSDFHAPNFADKFKGLLNCINTKHNEYNIIKNYNKGNAEGILWGGNLSTVVSLCGQDFLPDEDFIFFTEDLNEPVYKIDRMFQQLLNIDSFRCKCRGIVFGDFLDVDNEAWLEEYFIELSKRLNIPVVHIEGITHGNNKITLPVGVKGAIKDNKLLF